MILAGDIGATHTRLAAFNSEGSKLRVEVQKTYFSKQHQGANEIIADFVQTNGIAARSACFGVAGPVRKGRSKVSNLSWTVDSFELAKQLRLQKVGLVNDLAAYAYGLETLGAADLFTLREGVPDEAGNTAVVSAGSGLGQAGLYWDGLRFHPLACEGGHCDFAPKNEIQVELLRYLMARYGRVSFERILSGAGLRNVYDFLRDTKKYEEPAWLKQAIEEAEDAPPLISKLGLEGKAEICKAALDIFVAVYGAEAGNCALKFMATGGIYLGGAIAKRIIPAMQAPEFFQAFSDKGRMQSLLADIPIKIVLNEDAGIIGAAHLALVQKVFGGPTRAPDSAA